MNAFVVSFDPSTAPVVVTADGEELSIDHQKYVTLLQRIFLSSHAMNTKVQNIAIVSAEGIFYQYIKAIYRHSTLLF